MKARTKLTALLAGSVAALALGSIGWAAIPDGAGTIHGCYDKNTGQLRVTDSATNQPKGCTTKESPLTWNQQGPQGDPGESNVWFKSVPDLKPLGVQTPLAALAMTPGDYKVEAKLEVGSLTSPSIATCWLVGNGSEVIDTARASLYAPLGAASTTLHLMGAAKGMQAFWVECTLPNGFARDVKLSVTTIDNLGLY
jgi:hypothetical protein